MKTMLAVTAALSLAACSNGTTGEDAAIASDETSIKNLSGRVAALETASASIGTSVSGVQNAQAQLSGSLATLSSKLDTLNASLTALTNRIGSLENAGYGVQLSAITGQVSAAQQAIADLKTQATANSSTVSQLGQQVGQLSTAQTQLTSQLDNYASRVTAVETKTGSFSLATLDGQPAVVFSGVNLYLRNGVGESTTNGTGNLVIGYNAIRSTTTNVRTGSHNLIVGDYNNYSSYGTVVFGNFNSASAPYATVTGGSYGVVSAPNATISGGYANTVSGNGATASGGKYVNATHIDGWAAGALAEQY